MQTVRRREELAAALAAGSGPLALVPTMGALHRGHLSLIAEAKRRADRVAATIFVNPLQFNDARDLELYPRTEAQDLVQLAAAGCDLVWLPGAAELYPPGFATSVHVTAVADRWEGDHRPGHFDGVATVVAKLLLAVRPDAAIFGDKDWQQLAVIRRLNQDLGLGVEIVGHPTVREDDGLALSSRNARLTTDERLAALALPRALTEARQSILAGNPVAAALGTAVDQLAGAGFGPIDYLALVDERTLDPLTAPAPYARLIAAATIGTTRLIDNLAL